MGNAAIYFHPDGYDTARPNLMGRHAAGESFLRGLIRHGDLDRLHLFNAGTETPEALEPLLRRIEPPRTPVRWLARTERSKVEDPGCLYVPQPSLAAESALRAHMGGRRYSICGVTHTISTARIMDAIADMATAPLHPWDALICTSDAVRDAVQTELAAVRADLRARLGVQAFPEPELVTIPLGVNVDDFAPNLEARRAWRERLAIPDDAIAALYLGRFHHAAKMNPAMMAQALEQAAKSTGRNVHWIVAGWAPTPEATADFHQRTSSLCPSVTYHGVDGREAEARFGLWSAADFFISFSDNVQETFGLTPVEAMAAGLPVVVTDWNGYRDTVRHGLDGFRIPTVAAVPGLARDLAYQFENDWMVYERYIGTVAQFVAIDQRAAVEGISALLAQPELRARMGATAREQARRAFDWAEIIPRYQALWAELGARRLAAPETELTRPRPNPRRMDPLQMFAGYPSSTLGDQDRLTLRDGLTWAELEAMISHPFVAFGSSALPHQPELRQIFEHLSQNGAASAGELARLAPRERRPVLYRGLVWLMKFNLVRMVSPPQVKPSAFDPS